jgi:PAS domain S-box-containing protein
MKKIRTSSRKKDIMARTRRAVLQSSVSKVNDDTRFASMVGSIADGIIATDSDGKITYLNHPAEKLTGWTLAESLARAAEEVFPLVRERTGVAMPSPVRQVLETVNVVRLDDCILLVRNDGREIPVDVSAAPIPGPRGKLAGVVLVCREVTRRLQNDRALRESQALLRVLIDGFPDPIFVKDRGGRIVMANAAAVAVVGKPREAITGKSDEEFYDDPGVGRAIKQNDDRIMASGHPQVVEELVLTPKGYRSFLSTKTPWRDADGKVIGLLGIARDITEHKKIQEEIQQSNRRVTEILASIQDDFYVLDHNWIFVFASQRFTSRIGKDPKDFVGNNIWEMFPKHLGTAYEENLRAAMERREVRRFEIEGKYTRGWYGMAAFPSAEGITVLGTDITEHKKMEEELKRSESEYRVLFEFNPQPMWMVDTESFHFLAVNQAALAQYGYSKEEFLSLGLFDLVHPDDHGRLRRQLASGQGRAAGAEVYTHLKKNGGTIKVEILAHDIQFEGKKVRLVQGRDVTRRLQVEEALKENLKLFLAFVESSTEPSLMTDEKGMILAVSKPGVELLCSSRASVVGQNVLRYIPSEQLPILEKSFDTLLREPLRPRIAVVRLRLLDGSNIWVEAVCSMLRVDDRIGGYIVSLKRLEIAALNNS